MRRMHWHALIYVASTNSNAVRHSDLRRAAWSRIWAGPAAQARRQPRHVQCSCCTARRNCCAPAGPVMQGITLHCRLVRLLNSSLSRVCTTGAPRCCERLAKDLHVACCAPRIGRNCHFLLVGDCQGIMPARADYLGTAVQSVHSAGGVQPNASTAPTLYLIRASAARYLFMMYRRFCRLV